MFLNNLYVVNRFCGADRDRYNLTHNVRARIFLKNRAFQ